MERQTLLRTDKEGRPKRPVYFIGRLVAHANDKDIPRPRADGTLDKHEGRYDQVFVYEDQNGGYMVGIAHQTDWHGEFDTKSVHECKTTKKVIDRLKIQTPYVAGMIEEQLCVTK